MARTNLSLGNLYRAVSGSARVAAASIGGLGGNTTNGSLLGFATDAITVTVPTFTYVVESTTENAQFSFNTTGSLFYSKVQQVANNYTCSFDNVNFTAGTRTFGTGPTIVPLTPAAVAAANYSEASSVLTMKYQDGYNINATNYGTVTTKTLYAVDVYNTINQPDFCLLFGTKITLANGNEINIEDLNVGDEIKAWVPAGLPDETLDGTDTGETEWRFFHQTDIVGNTQNVTVADLTFNFASGYFSLNNGLIDATGTHPLFVWDNEIEKYKFKNVGDILPGDRVIMQDETEVEITNIEIVTADVEIVTVNVENADVYISNGLISHNKGTTTQPHIPSSGLRMYLEPAKTASFSAATLPATGTPAVDVLDMSGYGTGVRPGAQSPLVLASGNPSYNSGASRKERYYSFNGTSNLFYKDITSNINGGITQFNTNSGTIHVWVRRTAALGVASRPIFDYGGFYKLSIESSDSGTTTNRIGFAGSSLGSTQATSTNTTNIWYMVSVAFQPSGTCTIYQDGASVGTFTSSAFTAPASTNYVTIGSNSGRTLFWNGQIGPVLFYNTMQAQAAVTQVYNYFSPNYK
jgi:hypothetical protein